MTENDLSPLQQYEIKVDEALEWALDLDNNSLTYEFTPPELCEEIGFVPDNQRTFTRLKNQFLPAIDKDPIGGLVKYLGSIYSKRKSEANEEAAIKTVRSVARDEIIKPLKIAIRDESHLSVLMDRIRGGGKSSVDWTEGDEPVGAMALRNYYKSAMHFVERGNGEIQPEFDEFISEASDVQLVALIRDSLENSTRKKEAYYAIAASASRHPAVLNLFNKEFGRQTVDSWHKDSAQ